MKLGMCMASLLDRDWEAALDATAGLGILAVEPMGGGHVPTRHFDPVAVATSAPARDALVRPVAERGLEIAALGCYGNFLDPDPQERARQRGDLEATIRAASEIGVRTVTTNAGCPAGAPGDSTPCWIANSLFPGRWDEPYRWQWDACVLPFWEDMGRLAEQHDVVLCLEPMAGDVVYNLGTFRRLREHAGERILCHVDPSHLWWQGIEIDEFVAALDGAIGYAHAKDVDVQRSVLRLEGWLPSCAYDDWDARSWSMRAIGHGHDETFWRSYLVALRRAGYDGTVSIEFQEPYLSVDDGLRMSVELLRRAIPRDPAPTGNWFETYADPT